MSWVQSLFNFKGRINRARFWAALGIVYAAGAATLLVFFAVLSLVYPQGSNTENVSTPAASMVAALFAFGIPFNIILALSVAAICVKRLHDRNKSGWWLLVFLGVNTIIPLYESISVPHSHPLLYFRIAFFLAAVTLGIWVWALIDLGFLSGTHGENRYGPDPLVVPETAAVLE